MYSYLYGEITEIKPNHIVLEVNNIGYEVIVPNPYAFQVNEHLKLFVFQRIREPDIYLYGFKTMESKDMFLKLISVTGIGPKTALSILAAGNINDVIVAIEESNAKFLTKFPGIGMKSAQQIILDLKGKLVDEEQINVPGLKDVSEALLALGYSKTEINKVLKKISANDKVEVMVKEALSILLK